MAEFKRLPTQDELSKMLYQMQLGGKSQQDIINENLNTGSTVRAIPDNLFQKMASGAQIAGQQVNKLGTAADVAKMFPGYTGQKQVNIPTGFNFAAKQDPMGGVVPQGLQTQQVNVNQLLQAIKPADVLGLTGAQQAYTDIGMGKAPNPMNVLDVAGLGVAGLGAGKGLLGVAKATKGLPVGMSIKDVTDLNQSTKKLFDDGWYHGTTGNIKEFKKDLLGETTGAESAKEGFFFARDPIDPPAEFAKKSAKGFGADQASGYAQMGGDREYKEAMRAARAAEKNNNWDEYDKQMQIAENIDLKRMNDTQSFVAKRNDARDEMIDKLQNVWFGKKLPQDEAAAYDKLTGELMPFGWYNEPSKLDNIKKILTEKFGDDANSAIKSIDKFKSVSNQLIAQESLSGANVMPISLRYKNPMVYDFKGETYRDKKYSELVAEAKAKGHDALILKNTFDPGASKAKLIDVGVVFEPNQIRSKFAQFDPKKINEPDLLAAGLPFGLLATEDKKTSKK